MFGLDRERVRRAEACGDWWHTPACVKRIVVVVVVCITEAEQFRRTDRGEQRVLIDDGEVARESYSRCVVDRRDNERHGQCVRQREGQAQAAADEQCEQWERGLLRGPGARARGLHARGCSCGRRAKGREGRSGRSG